MMSTGKQVRGSSSARESSVLMSATKSFTGALTGILVNKCLLDADEPVTHYLPELASTAYRGATVQHLL
ncbi:serine hydrolase domain-containing protein, partial [Mesorhizobium sp. LSHC412B00]|uniref:serine hydrolase n=1 Tax=Mesorhizobium sp. LSHC412B00 TaxID=1287285 RepID=UPI0012EBB90B